MKLNEGTSAQGITTTLHLERDSFVVQKTYDAEPHLERARYMREAQEGQTRWGNGKWIAHIPPIEYARLQAIRDPAERRQAVKDWLAANRDFLAFDAYLK